MNNHIKVTNNHSSKGIGFMGLLTILFIALKLIGIVNWSWLWVLAPLWIPIAIVLAFGVVFLLIAALIGLASSGSSSKRKKKRK